MKYYCNPISIYVVIVLTCFMWPISRFEWIEVISKYIMIIAAYHMHIIMHLHWSYVVTYGPTVPVQHLQMQLHTLSGMQAEGSMYCIHMHSLNINPWKLYYGSEVICKGNIILIWWECEVLSCRFILKYPSYQLWIFKLLINLTCDFNSLSK